MRFLIYGLIALAPLPLASARPAWQWLWVLVVGMIAAVYIIKSIRQGAINWPHAVAIPAGMVAVFIVWGFVQAFMPIDVPSNLITAFDTIRHTTHVHSVNPEASITTALYFLAHLVFFLCVFAFCRRRERSVNLLKFCGIVVAVYAAYGFIIYVSGNDTILWFRKWASQGALTSTFVNRNSFAAFAGIGLQCLIAYAFFWAQAELAEGRTGRELYRHILETMMIKAWWLPLAIFLTASALLLTHSRAGFGSAMIGVILLFVLSPNRYGEKSGVLKPIIQFAIVVAIGIALFTLSGSVLDARLQGDASLDIRFTAYPYIIEAISNNPITGYGLGTFEEVFRYYRGADIILYFDRAHSDYLEIVLTAGVPAAALLVIACTLPLITIATALKHGTQYRSFIALGITASIQIGLHSLVDFSLQMPAVSYLWVTVLAASLAVALRCKKSENSET